MSAASNEFTEVAIGRGERRPLESVPPTLIATRDFAHRVQNEIPCTVTDEETEAVADWVLNMMERFGAFSAQPVFTMDGAGPVCSWCFGIWPFCGHHHQSGHDFDQQEDPA